MVGKHFGSKTKNVSLAIHVHVHLHFCLTFTNHISLCRLARQRGANYVSISELAKTYKLPKTMLWKRMTGRVVGHGHILDGHGKGKVLTTGE